VVCVLLGALATIAVVRLNTARQVAQQARASTEIRTLATEIGLYDIENGHLPASLADIDRANVLDPWGNPYRYLTFGSGAGIPGDSGSAGTQGFSAFCITVAPVPSAAPGWQPGIPPACFPSSGSMAHPPRIGLSSTE